MADLIRAPDSFLAWKAASTLLASSSGTSARNLVLEIADPLRWDPDWFDRIDPRVITSKADNPRDVANTIFPEKTWNRSTSRDELYSRYSRAHAMGKKKSWGTYFLRLIEFGESKVNQLERAIEVMNSWKHEPGTAIVLHTSSAETDRPRPLGGPCLQLCQLQVYGGSVDMTVIYRNHDYFNKTLPNLVGIGRLMGFICSQTGRAPGSLVCHSGHAYSSDGKDGLKALLGRA